MKKIFIVFGTRPEAIKMMPLIKKLKEVEALTTKVCITAQHREMLDSVLAQFEIIPEYDLNLMSHGQGLSSLTSKILTGLENIFLSEKPDLILVHGDTTTTFSAALVGFYNKIPVGHVEAGLRSGNKYSPYPEEMNRTLTDMVSSIHFAPTEGNKILLMRSGIPEESIYVTGNTVIDALHMVVKEDYDFTGNLLNKIVCSGVPEESIYVTENTVIDSLHIVLKKDYVHIGNLLNEIVAAGNKIILMTSHRRENLGQTMIEIFSAVRYIAHRNPDVIIIFPYHCNPDVNQAAKDILGSIPNVLLIPPLDYVEFANLMAHSYLVMTDSGGIQEEAPSLGKPVIVIREETERPEAVKAGTVKVVGVNKLNILKEVELLLNDPDKYDQMAKAVNPYGDGKATDRIICALENWFSRKDEIEM